MRDTSILLLLLLSVACDKATPAPAAQTSAPSSALSGAIPSKEAPAEAPSATAKPKAPATPPTAVAAQHILVAYKGAKNAPKAVGRSKADALKRAQEVLGKARAGGDFSALVAEYSDDSAAKERQGSVGKFTREKMTKPFSDAAFALDEGGISEPVETEFGFHIIKRNQ